MHTFRCVYSVIPSSKHKKDKIYLHKNILSLRLLHGKNAEINFQNMPIIFLIATKVQSIKQPIINNSV